MTLATLSDTITALSTPPGTSAIASIRLTGADAIRITSQIIESPEKLFTTLGGGSIYTNVIDDAGESLDDVIIAVYRAPHSYTGEDLVEIHTHGSEVITSAIQERLVSSGARLAEPGEFSRRAFMHGKMTLETIERTNERISANDLNMLSHAESLVKKKFERLHFIYQELIGLLALVNAQIDFGESDQIEVEGLEKKVQEIQASITEFLQAAINKESNKGYLTVALTGPPNVGKSSLFNALLKYERSIVSETPGTTRDYVEAFIMLGGFRIKLIDTAGLRDSSDAIESAGITLGIGAKEEADIILRITDPESRTVIASNGEILIHNKSDIDKFKSESAVSALTPNGIHPLVTLLKKIADQRSSEHTSYSLSSSERMSIQNALEIVESIYQVEDITLLAEDIRRAADIFASLTGLNISEDNLNHIFLKMCIGK